MGVYYEALVTASAGVGQSGAQAWVPLNIHQNPFGVSFFINRVVGGGDSTCRVEHTHVNVLAPTSGPTEVSVKPFEIFRHEDASAVAVSSDGNYAFPVRAIRLWVTPGSGATTYRFNVIQGDGA